MNTSEILAPLPTGSGAITLHKTLARHLPGYSLREYSPLREYLPFVLPRYSRHNPALIHTAPDHAIFLSRRNVPLVVTFHNYVLDPFMRQYSTRAQRVHYATGLRIFIRRALARASAVTAVSEATAALVRVDLDFHKILVIPNGVDATYFYPPTTPRPLNDLVRVLFAGNLIRRKGAHWLPMIAAGLRPGIELQLACGLRGSTFSAQGAKNIKLLGRISPDTMPALYRSVDILLMPTVREGGPSLAVLEAMASGLPIVATDIPEIAEVVVHEKGGLLCPVGDVGAFSEAINALAEDAALRRTMGEYNRARVEAHYRTEQMVENYRLLFDEILAAS